LLQHTSYRDDVEALLSVCAERRVAVQTIKSIARRRWRDDDSEPHFSWYKPIEDDGALARAVRFVLSNGQLFLNTSSDARLLSHALEVASGADWDVRPSDSDMDDDLARLDITPIFDGGDLERI
jgi:hypothetical protein